MALNGARANIKPHGGKLAVLDEIDKGMYTTRKDVIEIPECPIPL